MAERINIKRNNIVIERNIIERSLMKTRDFLRGNRKIFLGALIGLLVICIAGIGAYLYIDSSMNKIQVRFEKTFEKYRTARESGDSEKARALINEFDDIANSSMFGFYHDINYYMIGNMYFDEGRYDKAIENLVSFADKRSSGLYVELALIKAATAAEETGKVDEALNIYKRFEKNYPESIVNEQAFFNIAAVYEKKKDRSSAREYYNRVISLYPQSVFAQRAKKRLVLLSSSVM
jgi:tetratricopeptide (TPR) repeat protein